MSKAVRLDHEFNQHRFVYLLEQAKGNRSQTEFAKESGLSVAYICKYLNHAFDTPPIPSTIKKIAAVAANGVTYEELMEAAGYNPSKHSYVILQPIKFEKSKEPFDSVFEKKAIMVITSSLSNSNLKWLINGKSKENCCDFEVELKENKITNWYFIFIQGTNFGEDYFYNRLNIVYSNLVFKPTEINKLYSFVTESQELYDYIINNPPTSLASYISVILIDTNYLSVIKQDCVKTAFTNNDSNMPKL